MNNLKRSLFLVFTVVTLLPLNAQQILSHSDYRQKAPFTDARNLGINIIEADLYIRGKELVVCGDPDEILGAPTFGELYIEPVAALGDDAKGVILITNLKDKAAMKPLAQILAGYPGVFREGGVEVVVGGERPALSQWASYPGYIHFEGRFDEQYTPSQLGKVWIISGPITDHTTWDVKGMMDPEGRRALAGIVERVHGMGKKVRFLGTRDNVDSWLELQGLGVDVINTRRLPECVGFFSDWGKKRYTLLRPQPVYTPTYGSDGKPGKVKNVIVIIGDGMGLAHLAAAETANRGELSLFNMKNIGFQKTQAVGRYNPDSSSTATALFTGEKTKNGLIAMGPEGEVFPNSSELFTEAGKKIGLVTTGEATDATMAVNYAHTMSRGKWEDIATQLLPGKVSLLVGMDNRPFNGRSDGRDLFAELEAAGYAVTNTTDSISLLGDKVICMDDRFNGFTGPEEIPVLGAVTLDAIGLLDNPGGFFLMVESARIDHASHSMLLGNVILETLSLDAAVAEAMRFADSDGQTLVVVTGDHETGSLTVLDGNKTAGYVLGNFASGSHSGMMLPVFAYGPGSDVFCGVYENNELFRKIVGLFNR